LLNAEAAAFPRGTAPRATGVCGDDRDGGCVVEEVADVERHDVVRVAEKNQVVAVAREGVEGELVLAAAGAVESEEARAAAFTVAQRPWA
jgi:hypothetical protein